MRCKSKPQKTFIQKKFHRLRALRPRAVFPLCPAIAAIRAKRGVSPRISILLPVAIPYR